ncbi:hypothetical protein GQ457_10G016170 [Hibiscus cannabinus]
MCPHTSLKQQFLKKWIMGLQRCSFSKKNMSILERKKTIKLSADIAMASARNGTTRWSRALISNASKDGSDNRLVQQILGPDSNTPAVATTTNKARTRRASVCKKIVKRSHQIRRRRRKCVAAAPVKAVTSSISKHLVRKRTQVLKTLIPGGEFMDEICLIEETLDYITSLRVQVDVMRSVASACFSQS